LAAAMKKIDWYIFKKFMLTFFFSILLFALIAIVIDVSEKTDDFVQSGLSAKQIITQYYYGFIPRILAMLFPLFVFIAVIFFTSKMAGRSEVIAILASGTSYRRFLRPYFIGGLLLASVLWFFQRHILPKANEIFSVFQVTYIDKNSSYNPLLPQNNNKYFMVDSFTYAGINYYDTVSKTGSTFFMHRIKGNQLVYNLRAESLRWDTTNKRNKWVLTNVYERSLDGLTEHVSLLPEKVMDFNFKPFDLRQDEYAKDKLNTPDLKRFIKQEELRGTEGLNALKVEYYKRDATPLAVLVLALIGAVVASRRVRGGSGMHLAIGITAAVTYVIFDRFSTIFSTKGSLHPFIAAWIPNVFFIVVAIYMYKKAPK
jgi:lipopolysaccharide export system permease protein